MNKKREDKRTEEGSERKDGEVNERDHQEEQTEEVKERDETDL